MNVFMMCVCRLIFFFFFFGSRSVVDIRSIDRFVVCVWCMFDSLLNNEYHYHFFSSLWLFLFHFILIIITIIRFCLELCSDSGSVFAFKFVLISSSFLNNTFFLSLSLFCKSIFPTENYRGLSFFCEHTK